MRLTPKIKDEIRKVVWDYNIDEKMLEDIFEGKKETFSLNKSKLYSRLLMSMGWYKLLGCFGIDGVKEMLSDEVINSIWIRNIRERLFYARDVLNELS